MTEHNGPRSSSELQSGSYGDSPTERKPLYQVAANVCQAEVPWQDQRNLKGQNSGKAAKNAL